MSLLNRRLDSGQASGQRVGSLVSEETEQGCDPSHICPGKTFNSNPFYQMEGGKKLSHIYVYRIFYAD